MKTWKTVLASAIFLTLTATAHAGTLATGPAPANASNGFFCNIVNIGAATAAVTIEVRDLLGAVLASCPWTLAPGTGNFCSTGSSTTGAYCHFSVPGPVNNFRATAVYFSGGVYTTIVPAQ